MDEQFDEAMVERLARVYFDQTEAFYASLHDSGALTRKWPELDTVLQGAHKDGVTAVLTALSETHAIVPLAALEQKDAVLREIIDYTLPYDSCQKCPHVCDPNQSCHEQYLLDEARKALGEGVTRHVR